MTRQLYVAKKAPKSCGVIRFRFVSESRERLHLLFRRFSSTIVCSFSTTLTRVPDGGENAVPLYAHEVRDSVSDHTLPDADMAVASTTRSRARIRLATARSSILRWTAPLNVLRLRRVTPS